MVRSLEKLREIESSWLTATYAYSQLDVSAINDIEEIKNRYYASAPNRFFIDSKFLLCGIPFSYLKVFREADKGKAQIYDPNVLEFDEKGKNTNIIGLREAIVDKYVRGFSTKVMNRGLSLYFYGANSRGKTFNALYLAYMININSCLINKVLLHPFFYISYLELMNIYNTMVFRPEENPMFSKFVSKILDVDLLIIDEIGKEIKTNSASVTHFERIIKERSAKNLPTIMVGNLRPSQPSGGASGSKLGSGRLVDEIMGNDKVEVGNSIKSIYGESVYAAMQLQYKFFEFIVDNPDLRKHERESLWEI